MKPIVLFFLLSFSLMQANEFTIRPTQAQDLIELKVLSGKVINEHFRKSIIAGYPDSPVVQNPELLNTYLKNMADGFATIFEEKQLQDTKHRLFTAIKNDNEHTIIGFCFSQQLNDKQAYIRYIIVDENFRDKGIGTALLQITLDSYENISSCELKTLAYGNEKTHAFYEKHGFVSDKIPAPLARKLCEHSDTITFILYHLDLAK